MKFWGIIFGVSFNILHINSGRFPLNDDNISASTNESVSGPIDESDGAPEIPERDLSLKKYEVDSDEPVYDSKGKQYTSHSKKPCAIVVLSNVQNANMQSLLRKYRYDANGLLIPSSVQYFIKSPRGLRSSPLLVPLTDKAFSPLGGFVRYYKEVPPIPQLWKR